MLSSGIMEIEETTLSALKDVPARIYTEAQIDDCAAQFLAELFATLYRDISNGKKEAGEKFQKSLITLQKAKETALKAIR